MLPPLIGKSKMGIMKPRRWFQETENASARDFCRRCNAKEGKETMSNDVALQQMLSRKLHSLAKVKVGNTRQM